MTGSSFGKLFKFMTAGESHGSCMVVIMDGVPSGVPLNLELIRENLNRRRPGGGLSHTSARQESDDFEIISGVFQGKTLGTPIGIIIKNMDACSQDYDHLKDVFRPGHADYAYFKKYALWDYRGGGRASARETVLRVCAGSVAFCILKHFLGNIFDIMGCVVKVGRLEASDIDMSFARTNELLCPDPQILEDWYVELSRVKERGDSLGSQVLVVAKGVPAGLGEPVYDRLDADLAKAMMSINAVKAVEIGCGIDACVLMGSEARDLMEESEDGELSFLSNHMGGISGGIATGQDIEVTVTFKGPSSLSRPTKMIKKDEGIDEVIVGGRHDVCLGVRAVPVVEAMMACVLLDHYLQHRRFYRDDV